MVTLIERHKPPSHSMKTILKCYSIKNFVPTQCLVSDNKIFGFSSNILGKLCFLMFYFGNLNFWFQQKKSTWKPNFFNTWAKFWIKNQKFYLNFQKRSLSECGIIWFILFADHVSSPCSNQANVWHHSLHTSCGILLSSKTAPFNLLCGHGKSTWLTKPSHPSVPLQLTKRGWFKLSRTSTMKLIRVLGKE